MQHTASSDQPGPTEGVQAREPDPTSAPPARAPLPPDSVLVVLRSVVTLLSTLEPADIQNVLSEIERTDAFMPFFDPTGYLNVRPNLPDWRRMYAAFLDFRVVVREITGR